MSVAGDEPLDRAQAPTTAGAVLDLLAGGEPGSAPPISIPQAADPSLRLLRRVGVVAPSSLDDYRAHGGYAALHRALELGPDGVLREVKDSKLVGRGGAAFPTGVKWEAVARQPARPHYLVCNADESEPGTFKDRELIEGDPFAVIEAMTIAAYATGCEHGYVYLRGEYPQAQRALEHALAEARSRGLLGGDVIDHGFSFDVELRRGAGAYICGEETAIFESIEGRRGEPRAQAAVPGGGWALRLADTREQRRDARQRARRRAGSGPPSRRSGRRAPPGRSSSASRAMSSAPGVRDRFGATLRDLLELAGGVPGRARLQAVLLGGAAGSFVGPDASTCR